jgi:hypothetical protein
VKVVTTVPPHQREAAVLETVAGHHSTCDIVAFAQKIVALLSGPEPVLLSLAQGDHAKTITLVAYPYERAPS